MAHRRVIVGLFGLALLAACSDPTTPVPSTHNFSASPFPGELATVAWQARGRALVAGASSSPLAAARIYAALGVAQYHAISAANNTVAFESISKENGFGAGGRSLFEMQRGAIAGASARVLGFLFPSAATALDARVLADGDAGPGEVHPQFTRGVEIGRAAGDAMVQHLQSDGFTAPFTGTLPSGPGLWVANGPPAGGSLPNATPYFLSSASQFRPGPPPVYLSSAFNTALAEVATFALNRTPAQVAFVLYWNAGPGTYTPPGYWNELAASYITEQSLNETAAAHVFGLVGAAIFDAQIACWDAKYYYMMLRPTQADPSISLAIPLPNHPSYPSGHSCVSGAAATVLTHFFPQHAADVANAVTDAGLSRVIAGIHYRFDIVGGNAIGTSVGQLALSTDL